MFNAFFLVITKEVPSGLELGPPFLLSIDSFMNIIPFVTTVAAAFVASKAFIIESSLFFQVCPS